MPYLTAFVSILRSPQRTIQTNEIHNLANHTIPACERQIPTQTLGKYRRAVAIDQNAILQVQTYGSR